jgi:hypothetical protein
MPCLTKNRVKKAKSSAVDRRQPVNDETVTGWCAISFRDAGNGWSMIRRDLWSCGGRGCKACVTYRAVGYRGGKRVGGEQDEERGAGEQKGSGTSDPGSLKKKIASGIIVSGLGAFFLVD